MKNLNKATLIGNVVKDPELKYTPQGTAVVSFSVATNRDWKDAAGAKKEEATFHRVTAWSKLAEIISQYVVKGSKVYLEGRISNRTWKDQATGVDHYMTEIVADELILLDNKKTGQDTTVSFPNNEPDPAATVQNEPENEEMPF